MLLALPSNLQGIPEYLLIKMASWALKDSPKDWCAASGLVDAVGPTRVVAPDAPGAGGASEGVGKPTACMERPGPLVKCKICTLAKLPAACAHIYIYIYVDTYTHFKYTVHMYISYIYIYIYISIHISVHTYMQRWCAIGFPYFGLLNGSPEAPGGGHFTQTPHRLELLGLIMTRLLKPGDLKLTYM